MQNSSPDNNNDSRNKWSRCPKKWGIYWMSDLLASGRLHKWMNEWRTLLGAVPMVTMAQSAANWHNIHTHMDRTHLLTHLQYINTVTTTLCKPPIQRLFFSACWVFLCFRNPPNSNMEYRDLYQVYTIILACAYTHRGWAHWQESAQHFWSPSSWKSKRGWFSWLSMQNQ